MSRRLEISYLIELMKKFILLIFTIATAFAVNDVQKEFIALNWHFVEVTHEKGLNNANFNPGNAVMIDENTSLPVFTKIYDLEVQNQEYKLVVENPKFEVWEDVTEIIQNSTIPDDIQVTTTRLKSGNTFRQQVQIGAVIKEGNQILKLKSFDLKRFPARTKSSKINNYTWKTESVLKDGKWLKISTNGKGIYKLPYSKLFDWGFSNPGNVNVFGSGALSLSENPANIEYDDLPQLAVWHGTSNGANCLFFFAPGAIKWRVDQNNEFFEHSLNDYATKGFFFLTEDVGGQKEVSLLPEITDSPTHEVSSFTDYRLYQIERYNLLPEGSGKQWFGDKFINSTTKNFGFELTDLAASDSISVKINAAARSSAASEMPVTINQTNVGEINFSRVETDEAYDIFADERNVRINPVVEGEQLDLVLKYFASNSNSEAWLDYIEINYRRNLKVNNEVLFFRDVESVGDGNVTDFTIQHNSPIRVFDVTDMHNVAEVTVQTSGNNSVMRMSTNTLKEFAAFNPDGNFPEPELIGEVENQNLHALETPEFLIITHPNFLNTANELADFHRTYDGMDVEVVKSAQVYNEFSSGTKNATGIRNFIKMFYDRQEQLKYVLLFGDGSYDNKGINPDSKNFIPTYQSRNSLNPTSSFLTDDYYVILDDNESVYNSAVDLGIGRIPASTTFQAELVMNKIRNYHASQALGNWRNIVSFIGDDEDGNLHMSQSEQLANGVNFNYKEFITDKIYFDAFMQETTPAGERYPGVTEAINQRVKDGVLILNYVGHANARFMADEHVLDVSNINSWSNSNSLPIFVTATCEFSRFDADDDSAGEYVLFNPSGGGIGLFSTTRLVYAWSNFQLSKSFYNHVFERDGNGEYYRMGDIMRLAKINTRNDIGTNKRNFSLLADPALRLSYPKYKVVTTEINQMNATSEADTIGALQKVSVTGYLADQFDNKLTDFNGEMIPTVYDKAIEMKTLGNAGANPMTFKVQENVIYRGLTSITNGEFTFSFVIPKDISYSLGQGKIVYYADNGEIDAHGAFENFFIGGSASEIADNQGPEIELYMDSPDFASGDRTSKNPTMIAYLSDENGINTVGTGIGHDITAVLDNDFSNVFVLNNFYQANIDDYTGGQIRFPFRNLSVGEHTLILKAWDVANNSTEVEITFVVTGDFEITDISNYPNPVSEYTFFQFEHNQSDETLDAIFEIYDQSGRQIDNFNLQVGSNGTTSNPVRWDLNNLQWRLQNGIYFYKITAQNNDGVITSKSGKMMVVH